MRLPDRVDGVADKLTDTSTFLISIALSCCFSVLLVAMGIKFPWFRRQMRLGSMAQMTATVNANSKKENTARVANVPSQGVFKRWDDVESGPPPEPPRVALRKDRAPAIPPPVPRSASLPPASRRNNAEGLGRRSEVPVRQERASAKETSEAKRERKLEEAKRKEEKRQDSIRKKAEEKRKLKGDKRRGEAVSVTVINQQPPRVEVVDAPGPSGLQLPPEPPRGEPQAERATAEPPSEALVVSGTEVKGKKKDKDKKKKRKKEAQLVAPPSSRNAEAFKKPTNPMARRPSAPPTAVNAVIFQKMNGGQKPSNPETTPSRATLAPPPPAEMMAPSSPRPAIKSQTRPRLLSKKKAPLGKAVPPPRISTPSSTPPPSYEVNDSTPREAEPLKGMTFESDGFLSFRLPEAPEPLEVHPAFFALSGGDESDECDA